MRIPLLSILLACSSAGAVEIEPVRLGSSCVVSFASAEEASEALADKDLFARSLSPLDRQIRMVAAAPPSSDAFFKFAAAQTLDWPAAEAKRLKESIERLRPRLAELAVDLPESITLIRTNGKEDVAPYTRGTSIVFHPKSVKGGKRLDRLLAHELFHVISRNDPKLRDRLYAIIGFEPCGVIEHPEPLKARRLTNPDAPQNAHFIRVEIDGKERPAIPILIANAPYDPKGDGNIFSYLSLKFLVLEKEPGGWRPATKADGSPYAVAPIRVTNFEEQIGRNTGYIIHPEEILADNFAHLIIETKDLPNPEIVAEIARVLKG
jgi:hypothetical protein